VDTGFRKRSCSNNKLEHDPEKWMPVFGKDHAPTIIERHRITVARNIAPTSIGRET
jgi:hypothetical protein